MKPATLKALRASIAHWERFASGNSRPNESPGTLYCALCRRFNGKTKETDLDCKGCPVYAKTGLTYCDATPYEQASEEWDENGDSGDFRNMALLELKFLRSLLPRRKKQ